MNSNDDIVGALHYFAEWLLDRYQVAEVLTATSGGVPLPLQVVSPLEYTPAELVREYLTNAPPRHGRSGLSAPDEAPAVAPSVAEGDVAEKDEVQGKEKS